MKTWNVFYNSYYKSASYMVEEGPWWAFALFEASYRLLPNALQYIKFPKFGRVYCKDEDKYYNWREWYGDLYQYLTCSVSMPIQDFASKFIKRFSAEIDYDKLDELHPLDYKRDTDNEGEGIEKGCPDLVVKGMKEDLTFHEKQCERLRRIINGR